MNLHRSRENLIPHSFTHVHRNPHKSCTRSLGTQNVHKISGRGNNFMHSTVASISPKNGRRSKLTLVNLWLSCLPKSRCPCPCPCKAGTLTNHGVFDRLYIYLRAGLHHGPWSRIMQDGLFPWSDLMVQLPWSDFLKDSVYKVFGSSH